MTNTTANNRARALPDIFAPDGQELAANLA